MQIFLKETEGSYEHSMLVGTEPFTVADVRPLAAPFLTRYVFFSMICLGNATLCLKGVSSICTAPVPPCRCV